MPVGTLEILFSTLRLSALTTILSLALGCPLGALLAVTRFHGKNLAIVALEALLGMPPVVMGLIVYLLLSRSGPLGGLGLLFTPSAMVMAQSALIVPLTTALTRQTITDRSTWLNFENRGDLKVVYSGDSDLFNQYSVILINPAKYPAVRQESAQKFMDWLVSKDGQSAIASYRVKEQQTFFPDAEKYDE
jgi:hypothetical protein